jgi:RNA polymerase sigma factor (sigma-70 family)
VEASTLQAPAGLARRRIAIGITLLRLRSDEQLVELFRAGHDEAFRVIHDRYEKRLLAYTRQMLPRSHDAEDALQDVFVRAYSGLRSSHRELALRAWLFRIAHNRCIDELRRPAPPPPEVLQLTGRNVHDPVAEADRRESLRRLIVDVRRLPEQQRSALLMREMGGMSYAELACALGTSVPAVKSLLVRARIALTEAATARDTDCSEIREQLVGAHDRGVRPTATARRHMRDCLGCRSFRRELRTVNRRLAALTPLGPVALLAKTLGLSSGAGAGSGATASGASAGGGAAALGGATGGGAVASGAMAVGSGHVAALLAAAVATAGGAVAITGPPSQPKSSRPPANVQSANTHGGQAVEASSYAAADSQDGAAAAFSASLVAQTNAKSASQATHAALKRRAATRAPSHAPAAASNSSTADRGATGSSNSSGTTLTDSGASVIATLIAGSDPPTSTTSSSSSSSTGSDPQSGTGGGSSATSGQPSNTTNGGSSGSTSTGTGSGSSGTSTSGSSGTGTGSSSGTSSGDSSGGTGSSSDLGSGSGTSSSSGGTSTSSK